MFTLQRGSKKKLEFETQELSEQTQELEKSDTSASTPLFLLGRNGLCDASALSSNDNDAEPCSRDATQGAAEVDTDMDKFAPRESVDMFADSSLTYEAIKEDSQRLHTLVGDEEEVS